MYCTPNVDTYSNELIYIHTHTVDYMHDVCARGHTYVTYIFMYIQLRIIHEKSGVYSQTFGIHAYIHTHIHTYTHTYIHTYI